MMDQDSSHSSRLMALNRYTMTLTEMCPDTEHGYILKNDFSPERGTWPLKKKPILSWLGPPNFSANLYGLVAGPIDTYHYPSSTLSVMIDAWSRTRMPIASFCASLPFTQDYLFSSEIFIVFDKVINVAEIFPYIFFWIANCRIYCPR